MSRSCSLLLAALIALFAVAGLAGPAGAHGFTTVVYADATSPEPDVVRMKLGLEYDLMLVSVADTQHDDPFYQEGQPAWEDGDFTAMQKGSRTTGTRSWAMWAST
jgi:hypothetical protein